MINKIIEGDCLKSLREMPDKSVNCCITSPPYYGLRDYGNEGQIGLEETPEQFVEQLVQVFREVKRILKDDGTLWLNLGDSYATGTSSMRKQGNKGLGLSKATAAARDINRIPNPEGMKTKDLIGIPWMVAKALQQPYYTGKIKSEKDRIWLAAMIDGEGCMFIHKRKSGTNNHSKYKKKDGSVSEYSRKNDTYGAGLEVANTHRSIVDRCMEITGVGSICTVERETKLKNRNIPLHRWNVRSNECRWIIEEIYPYLVGKKHEARLLLNCPSSGDVADKCHEGLKLLHNGKEVDIDFKEPKSLYEQGWWLRQDLIWHKLNPMPESVTDRCTKAHEYIFLLSKSKQYYFDNDAIRGPIKLTEGDTVRFRERKTSSPFGNRDEDTQQREVKYDEIKGANKRSVWTVNTKPYSGAHFATFPEELITDCIKAGCPENGIVLDPFGGAGTTAVVARKLNRNYLLCELNPDYIKIAENRLIQELGLFI